MASGTITFTASGYLQGKIDWSSKSNGSSANTSSVTAKLYARRTNSYTTKGQSWSGYVKIGSTQKNISFSSSVSVSSSWVLMAEVAATVSHNNNGTGSVAISGSVKGPSGTSLSDNTSKGSKTVTLDTIARRSVLNAISNFTIGDSIPISITKYVTTATDTLTITLAGTTIKTISGIKNGDNVTFTSAELTKIYGLLPNVTSGSFTFTLTTSGVSGYQWRNVTGTISSSIKPTISSVTISEANTSVVPSSWGVYVKNKTKLKFVVSASAGSGSSVSSIKTTIDGSSYTGSTITTNLINTSGNLTATIVVTDGRGRTASTTKSITIQDYDIPYINSLTAIRCDKDGNALNNGTYAKVSLNAGIYSLSGKNTPTYSIKYKKSTESEYQTYTFDVTDPTIDESVILSGFETASTYNVVATIGDYFTTTNENMYPPLMGVYRTMNFLTGGKGGAVGKLAEKEGVWEIALKTQLTGGLEPIFLEADTDLDDIKTPNFYTGENITESNYYNCPITDGTFYLEVMSCGAEGQVKQKFTRCHKTESVTYERFYYQGEWGEWETIYSNVNAITVTLNAHTDISVTKTYTYVDVPLNKVELSHGSKLTLKDGVVKIGSGIKKVRVTANTMNQGPTGTHIFTLQHNDTTLGITYRYHHVPGNYETTALTSKVFNVVEGDTIGLKVGANVTGTLKVAGEDCTWVTVEMVE